MTVFQKCHWLVNDVFLRHALQGCTFINCHWLVNDILLMDTLSQGLWPSVIDISQWQKNLWTLSLTAVNDPKKCHWPRSMTFFSVIDRIYSIWGYAVYPKFHNISELDKKPPPDAPLDETTVWRMRCVDVCVTLFTSRINFSCLCIAFKPNHV